MRRICLLLLTLLLVLGTTVLAQRRGGGRGLGGYGWGRNYADYRTPRELPQHGNETPLWTNTAGFAKDVFTFARIKRDSGGFSRGGPWTTDTPDSDLNLSYRLQQVSSMKVNPDGRFLPLTEQELVEYPFIYMVEPGSLYLSDEEAARLRQYLLNGGFLWLDDFWGDSEWDNMEHELKKVFRDRAFVELPLTHPLYHCVFDIQQKFQIPNVELGTASQWNGGVTWESNHEGDTRAVHHKAIFDDQGRIMVFATHNTDNGDGWEWEGNNHYFFEHFSERIAYPLAVNVLVYTMTH
jgi:hypothetical protein